MVSLERVPAPSSCTRNSVLILRLASFSSVLPINNLKTWICCFSESLPPLGKQGINLIDEDDWGLHRKRRLSSINHLGFFKPVLQRRQQKEYEQASLPPRSMIFHRKRWIAIFWDLLTPAYPFAGQRARRNTEKCSIRLICHCFPNECFTSTWWSK